MTLVVGKDRVDTIVTLLQSGKLVALPTDTVFGLGAKCFDEKTYQKLMAAKKRPSDKPLPVMVADAMQIESLCVLTQRERNLIKRWMPGAVSFVFNLKDEVLPFIETRTLALRMPDDKWLQKIISRSGPLWMTSANTSGQKAKTKHQDVLAELAGQIDCVVEGESKSDLASSIFDVTGYEIRCLREGKISLEDILREEDCDENCNIK